MDSPQPVLIYDGHCRFCISQATRLQRWVRGRVRLESFRDSGVIARYPGLTEARCERALQLVEPDGRIHSGAEAVAYALRLRPLLAPIAWLYQVPVLRQIVDWGYGTIARNRFRLQGRAGGTNAFTDEACRMHQ